MKKILIVLGYIVSFIIGGIVVAFFSGCHFLTNNLLSGFMGSVLGGLITAAATASAVWFTAKADRDNRRFENIYKLYQEKLVNIITSDISEIAERYGYCLGVKSGYNKNTLWSDYNQVLSFEKEIKFLKIFKDEFKNDSDIILKQLDYVKKYIKQSISVIASIENDIEKGVVISRDIDKIGVFELKDNGLLYKDAYKIIEGYCEIDGERYYSFILDEFFANCVTLRNFRKGKEEFLFWSLIHSLKKLQIKIEDNLNISKIIS